MLIIIDASFCPSSLVFIKAPSPILISINMYLAPIASFLLIIDEAIKETFSTVAVVSRSA